MIDEMITNLFSKWLRLALVEGFNTGNFKLMNVFLSIERDNSVHFKI